MRRRTESLAVARRDASPAPDIEGTAVGVRGRRASGRVEVFKGVPSEEWRFEEAGRRVEDEGAVEGSNGVEEADSPGVGTNILLKRISIFFCVVSSDEKWV